MKIRSMKDRLVNIFRIDDQLVALPLMVINRIVRSAKVKTMNGLPSAILGILNLHGDLLPVVDLRHQLGLDPKNLTTEDRFVIISNQEASVALVVSEVLEILNLEVHNSLDLSTLSLQTEMESLICLKDEVVIILNTDQLMKDIDLGMFHSDIALTNKKKLSA